MRYLGLILAGVLAAGAAWADTPDLGRPGAAPKPTPLPSAPASVWVPKEGWSVEHLQSGLVCERQVYGFRRVDVRVFDGFGLDVACGYGDGKTALTLYVTRASPGYALAMGYALAKDAIAKNSPQRRPTLISDGQVESGGLEWSRAIYGEDEGLHSALWLTMLSEGWVLEYRATYPADREGAAEAALARLTQMVLDSAGRRLDLCRRRPPPARAGAPLADLDAARKLAMASSLLGVLKQGPDARPAPAAWCPEAPVPQGALPLLFWRGVDKDGGDARVDKVTAMTMAPPPTIELAPSRLPAAQPQGVGGPPVPDRWMAFQTRVERTLIFGYFDGRPEPQAAAALAAQALQGKVGALGAYDPETRSIDLSAPKAAKP
jgi:hypothetical protein